MTTKNRGIVKIAQGQQILTEVPIPKLKDGYILLKTVALALNPTDWQTLDETPRPGTKRSLLGCDAAGIVLEAGKGVNKDIKKGDRVAGFAHGGNDYDEEKGAFAEYIVMKGDLAIKIPSSMTFEEAATLGCGSATIALGFYRHLGLPFLTLPLRGVGAKGPPLLIYGGSSATGTLAIQFAKLSGLTVITTASPHNFDLLKSLGTDHVFDYRDPQCGSKIRSLTNNKLTKAFDTIATPSSAAICAEAMSSDPGGLYVNLMGIDFPRSDVRNVFYLGYTLLGDEFEIEGEIFPAAPEDYELGKKFTTLVGTLLEEGSIRPHPSEARYGIENIPKGMQDLKDGKVSGVKLVYVIGEASQV